MLFSRAYAARWLSDEFELRHAGRGKCRIVLTKNGNLSGVRVVKHRETPGLGDAVDISHSNWILGFNDKSLSNPDDQGWKVKRDGGIFDQFTGATITPRAVVNAVHNALLYFEKNQDMLFSLNTDKTASEIKADTKANNKANSEAENSKQP